MVPMASAAAVKEKCVKIRGQRAQPHRKYIRHLRQLQAEEILHLRAGN